MNLVLSFVLVEMEIQQQHFIINIIIMDLLETNASDRKKWEKYKQTIKINLYVKISSEITALKYHQKSRWRPISKHDIFNDSSIFRFLEKI